ncbi:hypothetical protein [uncultured Desulfobulbus sp.]|uniref:hypothetical protein n=1 Tax=uncultured Desulfobulbus sp. TaxID=239745 RepID=UPI0029C679FE|nr:hypothetical protein [uncultured Desulfobulbus sp.]
MEDENIFDEFESTLKRIWADDPSTKLYRRIYQAALILATVGGSPKDQAELYILAGRIIHQTLPFPALVLGIKTQRINGELLPHLDPDLAKVSGCTAVATRLAFLSETETRLQAICHRHSIDPDVALSALPSVVRGRLAKALNVRRLILTRLDYLNCEIDSALDVT